MRITAANPRDVKIVIHDHARLRIEERFPGFKKARMADEVRLAFAEGRIGLEVPEVAQRQHWSKSTVYAWTPDFEHIYALRAEHDHWQILTVIPRRERVQ